MSIAIVTRATAGLVVLLALAQNVQALPVDLEDAAPVIDQQRQALLDGRTVRVIGLFPTFPPFGQPFLTHLFAPQTQLRLPEVATNARTRAQPAMASPTFLDPRPAPRLTGEVAVEQQPATVPEPGTLLLIGAGLVSLTAIRRSRAQRG